MISEKEKIIGKEVLDFTEENSTLFGAWAIIASRKGVRKSLALALVQTILLHLLKDGKIILVRKDKK